MLRVYLEELLPEELLPEVWAGNQPRDWRKHRAPFPEERTENRERAESREAAVEGWG